MSRYLRTMEAAPHPWPTLGVLLMRDGLVTKEDLEAILGEQRDSRQQRITGRRLGELLVVRGVVTQAQVAKLVAEQYELPFVELEETDIDPKVAVLLSEDLARRFSAVPINFLPDGSLLLAIADPSTVIFSDELRRALGAPPRFAVVGPEAIDLAIAFVHERPESAVERDSTQTSADDSVVVELRIEEADTSSLTPASDEPYFGSQRAVAHLWPPLGALLIREGLVSDAELETALAQQRLSASRRLGEILVERGVVTSADVARLVAEQYELPFVELAESEVEQTTAALLPEEIARRYAALPIGFLPDGSLRVVVADPTNVLYSDELHLALGVPLSFAVADPNAIDATITLAHEHAPAVDDDLEETPLVADIVDSYADDAFPTMGEVVDESTDDAVAESTAVEEVADVPAAAEFAEIGGMEDVADISALEEPLEPVAAYVAYEDDAADASATEELADVDELTETAFGEGVAGILPVEETSESVSTEVVEYEYDVADASAADEFTQIEEIAETQVVAEIADTIALEEVLEPVLDEVAFSKPDEGASVPEVDLIDEAPAPVEPAETPAVDALDETIERAISLGASSIHFSPQPHGLVVRGRVDGVMRELETLPSSEQESVTTRLKSMTQLVTGAGTVDVRVDVLPTKQGEKVTLRVHEEVAAPISLTDLGMAPDDEETVRNAIHQPSGAIVVCGPTGSGKTTTLYAGLRELDAQERTLATIDDPVGFLLPGIDQIEVDPHAGLSFAHGLRAILGSDPDVILVGEVRDEETARVAVQAALTGHLVLSGLHAQTPAAAVRRLTDMGVEPGVLGATLTCVVAQRLVRRVCQDCRETYYATQDDLMELGRPTEDAGPRLLARGRGCSACGHTGFRGRAGLFEVLPLTDDICALVAERASTTEIQRVAVAQGMRTLREDGNRLCLEGVTTVAEVKRVLGDRDA